MYIHELTVRNFLIHQNTTVKLSPITVLIGPNGGGKSALFDSFLNFSMLARGSIRQAFGHYPFSYTATKYRGAAGIARIGFDVTMSKFREDGEKLFYTINYAQQGPAEGGNPTFQIFTETLRSGDRTLFSRDHPEGSPLKKALRYVDDDYGIFAAVKQAELDGTGSDGFEIVSSCAKEISKFNRFRLSPNNLSWPSRIPELESDPPRIGYEGEDLAACLYYMEKKKDPALNTIIQEVAAVLPAFEGFEFTFVGVDKVAFSMKFSDGRGNINAARMSHGNLIFLGLMVLTYSPNRPPMMLLEEPENGLTPLAIEHFYQAIRALAFRPDASQRSQILISSHSPFVMCDAWNGQDRDFIHQVKIEDGKSVIRQLSEVATQTGAVLRKNDQLGLKTAAELMSGRFL